MTRPLSAPSRRAFLGGAASVAAAAVLGLSAAPRQAGAQTAAYRVVDMDWNDASRQRAVPVRLYLPTSASAERPCALVVFSHGIGGSRLGYSYLGSHWASEGYASLHLQHVGSDRSVWTAGNPFAVVSRLQDAARDTEAIARVHDLRFALDQLLGGEWGPHINAQRIVAAGHSYGANTTLLAAGARVERSGRPMDLQESRLRAAVVLSAPPFYGEAAPRQILAGVAVPSLHVTTTDDVIRIPGYYSGAEDRLAVFEAVGHRSKCLAVFTGGTHNVFTDRTTPGGAELNSQVKQATRELTSAFLRSVLDGDSQALHDWPARHAAIVARFVGVA